MLHVKRRNFIKALSGTSLLSLTGGLSLSNTALAASKNQVAEGTVITLLTQPYLQHPTAEGITICWITSKPAHSWVEYWEENTSEKKVKKQTIEDGMALANNMTNRIRLDKLQGGKRYRYKVFSKEIIEFLPYKKTFGDTVESAEFSFVTVSPHKESVSMLILNDIHDRPHSFAHLEKLHGSKAYDEVFLNGDMFDYQTDQQQLIDHLIAPCTALFASEKPFLFVRGNHETRGIFTYQLKHYFENIGNAPYFSFSRGPVFFIALDTGEDKEDDHEAYYGMAAFDPFREEQAQWLDKILQTEEAKKALYRVVLMHIPPYHSGDWHGTTHCRKVFSPVFEKYQISLVVSGHTHRYGVHLAQTDHSYPIVIGGGPIEGNRTAIKLTANSQQLQLTMLLDDGKEVGSLVLKPDQ